MANAVQHPRSWSIRGKMLAYAKEHILPVASLADAYAKLRAAFPNVGPSNVYALREVISEANEEARKSLVNGQAASPKAEAAPQQEQASPHNLSLTIPGDLEPEARALIGELLNARMAMIQEMQAQAMELASARSSMVALSAKCKMLKKINSELVEAI